MTTLRDATDMLAALASGRVSAVELLKAAFTRYEQTHARLNAVIAADPERALLRARALDERRAKGETLGPLAGLPMTVKDTFDVEHMAASAGIDALRKRREVRDAAAVAAARQAGAVIWGKTNVPVMAGDWQSFNKPFGTTNNPWNLERTPGGSSGGAAAALAAGITALEIGSDIGGSLRVPASFCGVVSHKPTYGLVNQRGHVPPAPGSLAEPDLNVVGPMARSVRDLRLLLSLMAPVPAQAPPVSLEGLKVGLWLEEPAFILDAEVRGVLEAFAGDLAEAGAVVTPVRGPVDGQLLLDVYGVLLGSIIGADMPEGERRRLALLRGPAKLARAFGAGSQSWAGLALAYTATHREWLAADEMRRRLAAQAAGLFQRFDVLIAPVAPVTAFAHDHRPFGRRHLICSNGLKIPYVSMLHWIAFATALGLPATAMPAGLTTSGMPVGLQVIGPRGADSRVLAIAESIEEALGGFTEPGLDL